MKQLQGSKEQGENQAYDENSPISDVETELFIGPPETRIRRLPPRNWLAGLNATQLSPVLAFCDIALAQAK